MFLCVDKDFTGYCVHIVQPAGACSEYDLSPIGDNRKGEKGKGKEG